MRFFHELRKKPWTVQGAVADTNGDGTFALATPKLGLRIFLGVVAVVFSLLVVAYTDRLGFGDWRRLPEPWLLWLNTGLLIGASVTLQWAVVSAHHGQLDRVRVGFFAAGILTYAFLAGQLLAWQQLVNLGYFAATNPALAFFFLLTALHGVHMVGGLVAWGKTAAKVWGDFEVAKVRMSIELCAIYWHFLLLVWLVLFALLLFT